MYTLTSETLERAANEIVSINGMGKVKVSLTWNGTVNEQKKKRFYVLSFKLGVHRFVKQSFTF